MTDSTDVASRVFERLLAPIVVNGQRRWDLASRYLQTYAPAHAHEASRLRELFDDAEYLVHGLPRAVLDYGAALDVERPSNLVQLYRSSAAHLVDTPWERRQVMAVRAISHNWPELSDRLLAPLDESAGRWRCHWTAGGHRSFALRAALVRHTGPITAVATGDKLWAHAAATAGADGLACVWNLRSGTLRHTLIGHRAPLTAVKISGRERRAVVVTGDQAGTVRGWDLRTGADLYQLTLHDGPVNAMLVLRGRKLDIGVSVGQDGVIRRWDLATGVLAPPIDIGRTGKALLACDAVASAIVVAVNDCVQTLDARTGAPRHEVLVEAPVTAVACHVIDDRSVGVCTTTAGTCHVWDLETGHEWSTGRRKPGDMNVMVVVGTEYEAVVATGGLDGVIRLWDLRTGDHIKAMAVHSAPITAIGLSHAAPGQRLFWSSRAEQEMLGEQKSRASVHRASTEAVHQQMIDVKARYAQKHSAVLNDLSEFTVVSASEDETVCGWSIGTGRKHHYVAHDGAVRALQTAEVLTRPVVITGGDDSSGFVWNLRDRDLNARGPCHPKNVSTTAMVRVDGRLVSVTGCGDSYLRKFDATRDHTVHRYAVGAESVVAVAIHGTSNDQAVVVAAADNELTGRLLSTGSCLWKRKATASAVVACRRDTHLVVALRVDGVAEVLDVKDGTLVAEIRGVGMISAVTIGHLADDDLIVTGTICGAVDLWDAKTGVHIGAVARDLPVVNHVAWGDTPDGPVIASHHEDAVIRLCEVDGVPSVVAEGMAEISNLFVADSQGTPVLIVAGVGNLVRMLEIPTGEEHAVLALPHPVLSASYADGVLLVGFGRELAAFTAGTLTEWTERCARVLDEDATLEEALLSALSTYGPLTTSSLCHKMRRLGSRQQVGAALAKLRRDDLVKQVRKAKAMRYLPRRLPATFTTMFKLTSAGRKRVESGLA